MHIYEIWESAASFVLVEDGHEEKESLVRGCTLSVRFEAVDWKEANLLARLFGRKGKEALNRRLAS